MTYEDGKYTIYTSDDTKFRISEQHFNEIIEEFLQHAEYGRQTWFKETFCTKITGDYTNNAFLWNTVEEGEELIALEYAQEELNEVVSNIEHDYYILPRKQIEDKF